MVLLPACRIALLVRLLSDCFSWDTEGLIKLTGLLWNRILINMYFSLCGMVSMQTREGVYWGSASVLISSCRDHAGQNPKCLLVLLCSLVSCQDGSQLGMALGCGGEEVLTLLSLM